MTLKIKLIIAAILAGLVAYSYVWTYRQGQLVGKAKCNVEAVEAIRKAVTEAENKFHDQREHEMRDAAGIAADLDKQHQRKTKELKQANEILKHQASQCLANPASVDLIRLLNASRGGPSPDA